MPSLDIAKYGAVFVLSASPWGELLIAVPAGIAMGLNPLVVLLVALFGNYLPVLAIYLAFALATRHPWIGRLLNRMARPWVRRIVERFGLAAVLLGTPWLGVYATTTVMHLLGMTGTRVLLGTLASLVAYGVAVTTLTSLAFTLF
jgi:hypothetical protein